MVNRRSRHEQRTRIDRLAVAVSQAEALLVVQATLLQQEDILATRKTRPVHRKG